MAMAGTRLFDAGSELVLGLVAPVGADLDTILPVLEARFEQFGYETNPIHLSHLLRELELETNLVETPHAERYKSYMDAGTEARRKSQHGGYLALSAAYQIQQRRTNGDEEGKLEKTVHVLRSLKHPEEVHTLRRIYGDGFFALGIHAPRHVRLAHLTDDKGVPASKAEALVKRDEAEGDPFGQRTRDTFELCDAFVSMHVQGCKKQIWRLLDLLFAHPYITPTADEHAMFLAYGASLRSADLSRQVGAVIVSSHGEVIATGANDAPKFGGGLYSADDEGDYEPAAEECGGRDYKRGYDSNAIERDEIIKRSSKNLKQTLKDHASDCDADFIASTFHENLPNTGVLDITEYGRAVHAEMEALLSCSRSGTSPRGGTLYSTTFPCHSCGKHIAAAGIKRVVYVEPYPKSRALDLHSDSITTEDEEGKVKFEPFIGVGPRRFIDLFSLNLSSGRRVKRKRDGRTVQWAREGAKLRVSMAPHSYLEREKLASNDLKLIMEKNYASEERH